MFNEKIISNGLHKLTKQEKKVALYAMQKGFEIIDISINNVVKETQTSLATVNRTFAKLGFNGYKFYKMALFSRINGKNDWNDELSFQKDHLLLSLENTFASLDYEIVDQIAKLLIKNNQKLAILGEGFSHFVARIFQKKLMKILFDVRIFDENLYYDVSSGITGSNILIIFSVHMINKSLFKKIEVIKNINKKIKIILFTTNPKTKNDPAYDYVLCGSLIDNYKMDNKELPSDSLIILAALANVVFDRVYSKNEKEYDELIKKIKW